MKKGSAQAVLDYLDARQEEMIDFACDLVATPSINPPGNEQAVAQVIQAKTKELGLGQGEVIARSPERPNLIYHRRGTRGSPRLIFNAHTDTKPVGVEDGKLWQTDPLKPTIVDGKLHGLGSTDMKGAVAAMVYAAAALASLGDPLAGDLLLILVANEEGPGEYGANWLVKNHNIQADFCLVGEACGIREEFDTLCVCARTTVIFKTKVYGTQMHSSISDLFPSVNASVRMGWVLWRMARDLKLRYEPHPFYPQGPTINLGDIAEAGLAYGVFSGYAEFGSDIRLIPGMTREGVKKDLEEFLEELRREDPELKVELELRRMDGPQTWKWLQGDEPFVGMLQRASARILGQSPPLGGFPAFTDGYWFHSYAGIPAIPAFGPGLLRLAHGPNEYVSTQGIIQASKIYALAALEYLAGEAM